MRNIDLNSFRGAYSATFTPYNTNNTINTEMLGKIVDFQLNAGLSGFFVAGSAGESFLLTEAERKTVLDTVIAANCSRGKVIAHIGHISTDAAVRLAKHAEAAGADMISAIGPIFFGSTFDHIHRHYSEIAATTDLPLLLYSMERVHGILQPESYVKLFEIENVIGMKYSGTNFFAMQTLKNMVDRPSLFFSGSDEHCLGALATGVDGCIGTTQNIIPACFVELIRLYSENRNRQAASLQQQINQLIWILLKSEDYSYFKAAMRYIGYDCGNFRKPFKQLTEQEYQQFAEEFDKLEIIRTK
ncbi:MAG: dihydrodipicolinate synthase family protein [Victivallaceae bacterium]|nr:dihydrodipicolinate synthase family protein [Victivallaceae bacterium]